MIMILLNVVAYLSRTKDHSSKKAFVISLLFFDWRSSLHNPKPHLIPPDLNRTVNIVMGA